MLDYIEKKFRKFTGYKIIIFKKLIWELKGML